ncbi:UDP-3-O-(3-hydroxymyristoyl)glucosamine N-acyltransferase [Methylocella sp.]|uniref:UDP-3-O-(3-hydroxymyristoyl)glucosamine N-acyltransferase n=1 Tax=Methylocella sp. TaxID=1978226 RepID=UPI0037836749
MTDPIFFLRAAQLSLAEVAALTGATLRDGADAARVVYGAAPFNDAEDGDLTAFFEPRRRRELGDTAATACFIRASLAPDLPPGVAPLIVEDPESAFGLAVARMYPSALEAGSLFLAAGVSPGASVHAEARLEPGVVVDPGAVIGPRVEIGSGSIIGANAVLGQGVRVGRGCVVGAQAVVADALIGDRVTIGPGARLGQPGTQARATAVRMPHVGRVILQDQVEVGANAAIGRGRSGDTVVGEGSIVGDLAQIGPEARIGRNCRVCAQAQVGAESEIGDFAVVGAQALVGAGARVGARGRVLPQAGAGGGVAPAARVAGAPARALRGWLRALRLIEGLARAGAAGERRR